VESEDEIADADVAGPPDSLLALVDRLSVALLRGMVRERAGGLPLPHLSRITTTSLPALKAFLEGEAAFRRSEFDASIRAYQRAVEADPDFALALYRLSQAHGWWLLIGELPEDYTARAARLAGRLPEREALLVRAEVAFQRGRLDGLPLAETLVRRHPDDIEAWFLLGEIAFHQGDQALVDLERRQAFARVVELDLTFTPAYIHLVNLAFLAADSAGVATWLETSSRHARDSALYHAMRIGFDLAFGTSRAALAAEQALGQMEPHDLFFLGQDNLTHPRFLSQQAKVFAAGHRDPAKWNMLKDLIRNAIARGKLHEALAWVKDPATAPEQPEYALYTLYQSHAPLPVEVLDFELSPNLEGRSEAEVFFVGGYAADRGRWADHALPVTRLREAGRAMLARGDSSDALSAEGAALALEGYGRVEQSAVDEGLRLLQAGQRQATGYGQWESVNAIIRLWLGKILARDRPREAVPYLSSLWYPRQITVSNFHLGKAYEELGRPGAAHAAYEFFTLAWRDADPELQPMVREARNALRRLERIAGD
jgi:tetratricopeptide (TPR) repeat protein